MSIQAENRREDRLYGIWTSMRYRCNAKIGRRAKDYSERGIKVCDEWASFENFRDWALRNGYKDNLTIERKDVNGNYCPDNCTWITKGEQARNRTNTLRVSYKGRRYTVKDLARVTGIKYWTLRARLIRGWSVEAAVETPVKRKSCPTVSTTAEQQKKNMCWRYSNAGKEISQ